ncbi:2OG-Fe(II) oxygenase [Pseudomonas sp. USHLN015]|uniref:2OG-Fe(II) oxygenase n=1 Tax=Pseudomonas sp. USHLN015 TaxID=3081296 RepID=UPI00301C2C9A
MSLDWPSLIRCLDEDGYALLPGLLDAGTVQQWRQQAKGMGTRLAPLEPGCGEWLATAGALPGELGELGDGLYSTLARLANRWSEELDEPGRYPTGPAGAIDARLCHLGTGEYLALRQGDGTAALPLRLAILLACPRSDFTGGEFVVTEQRPRMQSRATVLPLRQGDAVLFSDGRRPVRNSLGQRYGAGLKHGTSRVRSGQRLSLELGFPAGR